MEVIHIRRHSIQYIYLLMGQFYQCFSSHVIDVDPMSRTTNNTNLIEKL